MATPRRSTILTGSPALLRRSIELNGKHKTYFGENMLGSVVPPVLNANTNNWDGGSATALVGARVVYIQASLRIQLTGIDAAQLEDGGKILLINAGNFPIDLMPEQTSTAANRFSIAKNVIYTLWPNQSVELYNHVTAGPRIAVCDVAAYSATILVAIPTLAADTTDTVDIDTTASGLVLAQNDPILVNPTENIVAPGLAAGFLVNAFTQGSNLVRLLFRGTLPGGNSNFVFTIPR